MEEKERNVTEEAMNKLVKEILKNGDVKTVFDVESKLKKSFGKIIQSMLEAEMEEWKSRRLEEVYPFVYIDAIHFNVKENGVIGKKAAYIAMGISKEGIKEAIQIAFPNTEHQTCIVHLTRNTIKYVSHKDKYAFAQDLKAIYTSSDEEIGKKIMYEVAEKWKVKYPTAMERWEENWGIISPFFKFSQKIRKMIYTTNTIFAHKIIYNFIKGKIDLHKKIYTLTTY